MTRKTNILVMYSNQPPTADHVWRLGALRDNVCVDVADSEAGAVGSARFANIILGHRYLRQTLPHTRQLRWVQSTAAGVDHLLTPELATVRPLLTRCPIFSDVVALHAYSLALAVLRRIPEAVTAQQQGQWDRVPLEMLPLPRTALILGVGCVGRALARLLRANGLTVLGVTRRVTSEAMEDLDELHGPETWRQQLPRVDLCFVTLPLTRETEDLVDASVIRALPEHAVLVNVGRGRTIVTEDLLKTLRSGHLGGAALDVLDPLPAKEDPLWQTPRLLITPKVAVFHPGRQRILENFIEAQVIRFLEGEPLQHVVDIDRWPKAGGNWR